MKWCEGRMMAMLTDVCAHSKTFKQSYSFVK